jgi:hypothetical protein
MTRAADSERLAFSQRLRESLENIGVEASPTVLCKWFNLSTDGNRVSVHAVRKWLVGEAIPTQEKLRVLAHILGLTPEWLRFGNELKETPLTQVPLSPLETELLSTYRRIDVSQKTAFMRLVRCAAKLARARKSSHAAEISSEG